jgi:ABC-2 type transport system ATP-binding protein
VEQLAQKVIIINHGQKVFDDSLEQLQMTLGAKKIAHLTLSEPASSFEIENAKIIEKKSEIEYVLEIDLENSSMSDFINQLSKNYAFSDISIKELPMDKIITTIYESHE